ncbi:MULTISPECIES: DUF2336 domain-containing protein [Rhodopseudomonas]|uniref:DUF2336 domain-containing protein n=1 Tax=Rhodopseudomonas palustris TaxID=1076 RepID=A0A0D7EGI3_RHOPL|nr:MULTISPECIES: DUF2336 domain-containing protein [Rhodopseudomonas]KIZ39756.1 hypothetical protein OO17_19455 [Rhodopseudomonas palustris]MDF3814220.1 DUF2336 domain-containing protein [Rhodopseudomonas sp. BAL398]WOK16806.1 DUF2336 domain-containing protein [Rhodopseudomonas sp. BAL398]
MLAAHSLISGLDDVVNHDDPMRRAEALRKVSELFVQGAAVFRADHVALFDGVLTRLLNGAETDVRSELAARFAALTHAPPDLLRQLVGDEDIGIAGPLLRHSPLIDDLTLVEISRSRGQTHLMAISERPLVSPLITDVIVRRGDRDVVRKIAGNAGAQFSTAGFNGLVRRSAQDGVLALAVGQRDDLSAPLLKDLLACSADGVRRRLFDAARPSAKIAINRAMSELSSAPTRPKVERDYGAAQRAVVALLNAGALTEAAVLDFARSFHHEETVAALSALSGLRLATLDQLLSGERNDPVLILGKALGFGWAAVRAMIGLRSGPARGPSPADLEEARQNFERLAPATAQRVLGFWRTRQSDE